MRLACCLDSEFNLLRNALNGKDPPNCETLSFLGDSSHMSAHFAFSSSMKPCLSAEALVGSGLLRTWGKSALALEIPAAASLASLSASSFPLTLLWPEIHLTVSLQPVPLMADRKELSRCCPEVTLGCGRDDTSA